MKSMSMLLLISIISIAFASIASADQIVGISIESSTTGLSVAESVDYTHPYGEPLTEFTFWADTETTDVSITHVEDDQILAPVKNGNLYTVNLSFYDADIAKDEQATFRITYSLPALETFNKVFTFDTSSFTVTYKTKELYQGEDLTKDSRHHIRLYIPSEAPLNTLYIGIVIILVVLLMFMVLLFMRKQRQKTKKTLNEPLELLATKKALLLSVLKDIEKQHRGKDISDDTYSKLKEEYKQQAVEVMKKLDGIQEK